MTSTALDSKVVGPVCQYGRGMAMVVDGRWKSSSTCWDHTHQRPFISKLDGGRGINKHLAAQHPNPAPPRAYTSSARTQVA
jgi:hypothetical protein